MNNKPFFTLLLMIAIALPTYGQKTITLKFQPEAGTKLDYTIKTESENIMMGMSNPMTMEMKMTGETGRAESGLVTMINTFKSAKMNMTMMGQQISYDSENPAGGNPMTAQFGQAFGQILNKPITYTMNANGTINKMEGMENLTNGIGMGAGQGPNQFTQGIAFFPDKPVKIGDTWTTENSINEEQGVAMKTVSNWKLDAIDNGVAKISVKTDVSGKLENGQIPGMSGAINGAQSANMEVDIATGITLKSVLEQEMKMGEESMQIQIKSKTTTIGKKS